MARVDDGPGARRRALVAGAALTIGLAWPGVASAEPYLVLAPEALIAFQGDPTFAAGGSATLGLGLDLEPLLLAPELSLAAHVVPDGPASMLRGLVGARVGLAAFVEPSVYARVGPGMTDAEGAPSASGGVAIDAGAALDARLSRDLTLGGHLGYAGMASVGGSAGSLHALAMGARLGLWF
jgi:hypothetical protein